MDAGDDVSDSASMYSVDKSMRSMRSVRSGGVKSVRGGAGKAGPASVSGSVTGKKAVVQHRPVSSLKPKVRATTKSVVVATKCQSSVLVSM